MGIHGAGQSIVDGTVMESLPNLQFKVKIFGNEVRCYISGKLLQNRIRINPGDNVRVTLSPDGRLGRIIWRIK